MDDFMLIKSGIFFTAGVLTILFREQLNKFKDHMLKKLNLKNKSKNKAKSYVHMGVVFIIIALILFTYAITH